MALVNINGKILAAGEGGIRADNRALRYGYGLFETMLVKDGAIRLGNYHWERLQSGMDALHIPAGKFFLNELEDALWRTVRKAALEALCRVRVQVYAGEGGLYDDDFKAGFIIEVFPLPQSVLQLNNNGLVAGIADTVKHTGALSHIKSCTALPYLLAARQAAEARWNDAILLNEHGRIAESTIANIFWLTGDVLSTPPLSEGCIAGVMRRYLLEIAPGKGFQVIERPCRIDDIAGAESVFFCNAMRGISWVSSIHEHNYSNNICIIIHNQLMAYL